MLNIAREMPIGIVDDILYPMVLGCNWAEIYQVLDVVRAHGECRFRLAGEELDDAPDQDGLDLERLSSSTHSQEAQVGEEQL